MKYLHYPILGLIIAAAFLAFAAGVIGGFVIHSGWVMRAAWSDGCQWARHGLEVR